MKHSWSTACPDWQERLRNGRSLVPDLPLFEEEAAKAVRVFNRLRLPDVSGKPPLAEAAGDWFRDIVRALFGAYDPQTARRMIQEVFLLVSKKNMKTTGGAAIMVTALIVNRRPAAEGLLIAPTKEIADLSFSQASGMIRADPELSALFHIQHHTRQITHRVSEALLKIKAADTDVITGGKQSFTLLDETHKFAAKSRAAEVFIEVRGALAARPDGFFMQITTQSKRPPQGVFKAELDRARRVRDGETDLPLLPVLYEFPPDMLKGEKGHEPWRDPANWRMVNPNLGRSVDETFLAQQLGEKSEAGEEDLALFASQHFDIQIGQTILSNAWAGARLWEAAGDPALSLEDLLERCEVCTIGIDGGGLDDLLGLSVMGRERETKRWLHWAHAWCAESVLSLRKSEAQKLRDLEAAGDLTIIKADEMGRDIEEVADIVEMVKDSGRLPEKAAVGVDPIGIGQIVDELDDRKFKTERIAGIGQGYKLSGPIKTAERKLADGTLTHGAQPLMAYAVGNAKVEPRGNAILITKQASGTAKIDPLMAFLNTVALMSMNPTASRRDGPSVYAQPGFIL